MTRAPTNYASIQSPPVKAFKRETFDAFWASPEGKALALQAGLKRLFPSLQIRVEAIDYGNALNVSLHKVRDVLGWLVSERHGVRAPLKADPLHVGGKLLRLAYPRGWAQP